MNAGDSPSKYAFGDFELDVDQRMLQCRTGARPDAKLTPRVFDTLVYLLDHAGALVEKDALMKAVWPRVVVEENNLDQNISTLRHLLGERPGENRYIATERGRGFRFVMQVVVAERPPAPPYDSSSNAIPAGVRATAEAAAAPVATRSSASSWPLWTRIAAGIAIVIFIGVIAAVRNEQRARSSPQTLAVLPFKPLTVAERDESLELGVTETLIVGLGQTGLTVSPLSSVRRYRDLDQDALRAGRELHVDAVLEGTLQRDADRLRVSVRLVNVADGRQFWAARFDQPVEDIFSVQDAIAERVRVSLAPESVRTGLPTLRRYTSDAQAYDRYLSGRFHRHRLREASLLRAVEDFERAVERDPQFALAYVGLAEAHSSLGIFGAVPPNEAFPRAREAVDRALALEPQLGEAYASLGHIKMQYERDWSGAERAFNRAIELDPNYAPAQLYLAIYLGYAGRFDAAVERSRVAQALEPLAPSYGAVVGMLLTYQRKYEAAIHQLNQMLEMDPGLGSTHTYLALAHMRLGHYAQALDHVERAGSFGPGLAGYRGQIYALSGQRAKAVEEIDRLKRLSRERYVSAYDVAAIYSALGDAAPALDWLERAFVDGSPLLGWLRWDPAFDRIRTESRYQTLVARLDIR